MANTYLVTAKSVTLGSGTYRQGDEIPEHKIKHLAEMLEAKVITLKTATVATEVIESTKPKTNGKQ